ncbi:MAG TPA: hypothetical protein VFC80_06835 [Sphaerochaeta sp.]|nr:hypothetical protein [Sphaerochaeta sp.]
MKHFAIGLGIGLAVALIVLLVMMIKRRGERKTAAKEMDRLKMLLADRMDLESDGLSKIREEIEELKKQNENLRITVSTYSQKPGRRELARLNVYQTAVDRLTINSPGFGAAWQAALKESEEEFEKTYVGAQSFIKRLIPTKTDANVLQIEDT